MKEEPDLEEEIIRMIESVDAMSTALAQLNMIIISIILTLKREGIEIEQLPPTDRFQ